MRNLIIQGGSRQTERWLSDSGMVALTQRTDGSGEPEYSLNLKQMVRVVFYHLKIRFIWAEALFPQPSSIFVNGPRMMRKIVFGGSCMIAGMLLVLIMLFVSAFPNTVGSLNLLGKCVIWLGGDCCFPFNILCVIWTNQVANRQQ